MAYQNLNYSGASINNLLYKCDNASSGSGGVSEYITSSDMSSTYLTQSSASSSYQPIGSYMTTSTYNSLLDTSTLDIYYNNLNYYFNTALSDEKLRDLYYPVGSIMLTRCFYNDSTYGTQLIDPADLIGGTWTLMQGVIYQNAASSGTIFIGSNGQSIEYTQVPTPNKTVTSDSESISHTHSVNGSKKFYACQGTFGEARRNSPAGSGYYYPRVSKAYDFGGTVIPKNSDSHGGETLDSITSSMSLYTTQTGINIGIWRRTS